MGARYRTVSRHQWSDERVRSLSVHARLAWSYVTCNTHDHVSGVYVLAPIVACDETGMSEVEWLSCMRELGECGLAHYDPTSRVIWVANMLWRQAGTRDGTAVSPKMLSATEMHLRDLPASALKDRMVDYYAARYGVTIRALYAPQGPVVLDDPSTVVDLPDVPAEPPVAPAPAPRKVGIRAYQEMLRENLTYGWDGHPPPRPLGMDAIRIHISGSKKLHEAGVSVEMVLDTVDRWAAMLEAGETEPGPDRWKGTYLFSGYFDSIRSAISAWERKRDKRRAAIVHDVEEETTRLDPEAISRIMRDSALGARE